MYTKRNPLDTKLTAFAAPKKRFPVFKTMSNYDTLGQVGEGTYGQVFKAKDKTSLDFVALKKLYLKEDDRGKEKNRDGFPITGIREIEILRSLEHPNIVQLKAMVSISENFSMDMYMVFEYMDHDLTGLLTNSNISYGVSQIKCLSKQLFEGLAYLHDQQIIHRDIKGANLLLNNQGYLKIADFGLARRIHLDKDSGEPWEGFEYTNRVVTLWYRSPELLLGNTYYGYEVDIWSAGCILIEFYTRVALFQGRTEIDQLENIFKRCGSPNEKNWPNVKNMPWIGLFKFPHYERTLLSEFSDPSFGLTAAFLDLFDKLLTIDPKDRPSARAALNHPYFTSEQPLACRPHE
jgi:CTD kinase subunit alpha